jgi:hypothetical protein
MNELLVGYARVSKEQQDLASQRNGLHALGVGDNRIYVGHGLTGTCQPRPPQTATSPGRRRAGDTLVVTNLDRLARSLPAAGDIDELTKRNVKLSLGGSIHDPTDPVGRLLFNVLAMVAEFEADLIRLRTRGRNESSQGGHHDVGERPLGFDRFRPHSVDGAVTTATADPCKKPRPQSGLLRQVPPALEAATDAMSAIPRAEARPRHQAVPQIRPLATIRRRMSLTAALVHRGSPGGLIERRG